MGMLEAPNLGQFSALGQKKMRKTCVSRALHQRRRTEPGKRPRAPRRAGYAPSLNLRPSRHVGQSRARQHHPAAPSIRAGSGDETWPLLFLVPDKKIICHGGAGWVSGLGLGRGEEVGWVFIGKVSVCPHDLENKCVFYHPPKKTRRTPAAGVCPGRSRPRRRGGRKSQ